MKAHVVSFSQALVDGRLDPYFHIATAPFRERAQELESSMGRAEADAKLKAFPNALVKEACAHLARGDKAPSLQTIRTESEQHPFLAMAMIVAALPAYLAKLLVSHPTDPATRSIRAAGSD